jgi:hypothetical protein
VSDQPPCQFTSPSALREFAIETALQLRKAKLEEAGGILEDAANYVTSSGWEWLGELGRASEEIREQYGLQKEILSRVDRIIAAAKSQHPYGPISA